MRCDKILLNLSVLKTNIIEVAIPPIKVSALLIHKLTQCSKEFIIPCFLERIIIILFLKNLS